MPEHPEGRLKTYRPIIRIQGKTLKRDNRPCHVGDSFFYRVSIFILPGNNQEGISAAIWNMEVLIIIEAPGKVQAWNRITGELGMPAQIVASGGHICQFPRKLSPLGIDMRAGYVADPGRKPIYSRMKAILDGLARLPENAPILIAADNDIEGDVIACDVAEILLQNAPQSAGRMLRLRPEAITKEGISASLAKAVPITGSQLAENAVQGRARAVTDRWIGAVFSHLSGTPIGRVRTALLGASLLLEKSPGHLRHRPETGEIVLQARASNGGRPFVAHIALYGQEDRAELKALKDLAECYAGKMVPGTVSPLKSLSAAVAPRCGSVQPFNTADALAYAMRHHGLSADLAMRGLQRGYEDGLISYPRTCSRVISPAGARSVVMLGSSCGLNGLDVDYLSPPVRFRDVMPGEGGDDAQDTHEALHPVVKLTPESREKLAALIRRPFKQYARGWTSQDVTDLMVALVSRRAFEAACDIRLEPGQWRVDNINPTTPDISALLEDLDWQRDTGFSFPWTRYHTTMCREWPAGSVLLELMASEELGKPSTWAGHIQTALESDFYIQPEFPAPPRPSPLGIASLKKTPPALWKPGTCRMIEDALKTAQEGEGEQTIAERVRGRVLYWFAQLPKEIQVPLAEALRPVDRGNSSLTALGKAGAIEAKPDELSFDLPDLDVESREEFAVPLA